MAIFGRISARQRLRRATQETLAVPVFSPAVDCTPWVIGGRWPAELSTITAETVIPAARLKEDLQRIVDSANQELRRLRAAPIPASSRQAQEVRVLNAARGFALQRIESTVLQLRTQASEVSDIYSAGRSDDDVDNADVDEVQRPDGAEAAQILAGGAAESARDGSAEPLRRGRHHAAVSEDDDQPDDFMSPASSLLPEPDANAAAPTTTPPMDLSSPLVWPDPVASVTSPEPLGDVASTSAAQGAEELDSDAGELQSLLQFVARQEPALRWLVAERDDGATVVLTDLAHGWIPPCVVLPAQVRLLEPQRRTGTPMAWLGATTRIATYKPGDPINWAADFDIGESSLRPRELPPVVDLGWVLSQATHWRGGLPPMTHTWARAGASGTGLAASELDMLQVHLDTALHQLLAEYPNVGETVLLNCLLLAATEALASGDRISANYHFAWFQALSEAPADRW